MTLWKRALFHVLQFLDGFFPGWGRMPEPKVDHLSHESFQYWLTREYRRRPRE